MRRSILPILCGSICALCLVGCGGDDGGSSAVGGAQSLGLRSVPGYTIAGTTQNGLQPGGEAEVLLTVTPSDGMDPPQAVGGRFAAAGVGDQAWIEATPVADSEQWRVVVTLPDPLPPEARITLRLVDPSGNVMTTGIDDFRLPR